MEIAQSDAAAYFDWYRIETWKGYDERPDDEVTGNPTDDYERRAPGLGGMWEGVRYQFYESSDGHMLFMASEQAFWKNFCEGIGRMDLFEKWPGKKYRRPRPRQRGAAGRACATSSGRARSRSGSTSPTSTTPRSPRSTRRRRCATTRSSRTGSRWTTHDRRGADELLFPLHVEGEELPVPTKAPDGRRAHRRGARATCSATTTTKLASLRDAGALG